MNKQLEYANLDQHSFQMIADLAFAESGLQLVVEKKSMIQSRLRKRLKILGLPSFTDYSVFVSSDGGKEERRHMISALTTNVSHFFREQHHFEKLSERITQSLISELRAGARLRIWSAGCSNGQEACSIAITLLEAAPDMIDLDVRILATDIDPQVVDFARTGLYPERMMNGVSNERLNRFFESCNENGEASYKCGSSLKKLIRFNELNLLSEWPMKQKMDFIFCRNVVIYFNAETQNRLWPRFHKNLKPDGLIFLGHSERIPDPETSGFSSCGPTTYSLIGSRDHH